MALSVEWQDVLRNTYDGVTPTITTSEEGITINGTFHPFASNAKVDQVRAEIKEEQERYAREQAEAAKTAAAQALAAEKLALEQKQAELDGKITAEEQARINQANADRKAAEDAAAIAKQKAEEAANNLAAFKAAQEKQNLELSKEISTRVNEAVGKMQEQLDGEVSNWQYQGSVTPVGSISEGGETGWTDIAALSTEPHEMYKEWRKAKTANPDLTIKQIAERHVGDTYTNISPNVDSDATAGQSWRFVLNEAKTKFRWLRIADNEVAKALKAAGDAQKAAQDASKKADDNLATARADAEAKAAAARQAAIEAANATTQAAKTALEEKAKAAKDAADAAQAKANKAETDAAAAKAVADGKSTTFLVKPTTYEIGDFWVLETDAVHSPDKKGEILVANTNSNTYNAAHWVKSLRNGEDAITCSVVRAGGLHNGVVTNGIGGYVQYKATVRYGTRIVTDIAKNNGCLQWKVDNVAKGTSDILNVNSVTDNEDSIQLLLDREKLLPLVK